MRFHPAKSAPGIICSLQAIGRILKYDQTGRIFELPDPIGQRGGVRRVSILSELAVGDTGVIESLELPESVQNHLMHMGFVPDALITAVRRAPAGDPTVYAIDGMEIALRHETASAIHVRPQDAADAATKQPPQQQPAELAEVTR